MDGTADEQAAKEYLTGIRNGDVCGGTVTEVTRRGVVVTLDGYPSRPLGLVGAHELGWDRSARDVQVGQWITAQVTEVDLDGCVARMSMSATRHPELWGFLASLRPGEVLSGTVAAIERFGVFVALDEGPMHPIFPGVGFVTHPELSWRHFAEARDVVQVGQRVSGEFLQFDTWNGEARMSLKALKPDPLRAFGDRVEVGRCVEGRVTKLVPFGAFVEVGDGVEGMVHLSELSAGTVGTPEEVVQVGDQVTVVILGLDLPRRRLSLSLRGAHA